MTWRLLSHTADVKAVLAAPDLAGLYGDAVDLVRHLLVGDCAVASMCTLCVAPDGDTDGERFFRFVRELLYANDVDRFVPGELRSMGPPAVAGETFDPQRHTVEHGIKALTRHQYRFERGPGGCLAEIVFDL